MKTHQQLLSISLIVLLVCLNVTPVSARPPQSQDDYEAALNVEKLLDQAGQKYSRAGRIGVWVIRRNGNHLKFFQIILWYDAGTLRSAVIVAKAKSVRVNDAAPTLLRLVNRLDYVKIGLDTNDDLFVRNEARLKTLHPDDLRMNLDRVAVAADEVFAAIQQFQ